MQAGTFSADNFCSPGSVTVCWDCLRLNSEDFSFLFEKSSEKYLKNGRNAAASVLDWNQMLPTEPHRS